MLEQFTKATPYLGPKFALQTVLELACAAQRVNKEYVKSLEPVYADGNVISGKIMYYKYPNRTLMEAVLGEDKTQYSPEYPKPTLLCTNLDDKELADNIQKYYRRLMFAAIDGSNEFQTEVNALLNSEDIPLNKFGFIACLPSVYKRDHAKNQIEKRVRTLDEGYLDAIGSTILDKDCEILASQRSKNFDAWNIDAIIDNKMVSWMSKIDLKIGNCVVVKAKVKDHSKHWKHENPVTRLNFVKAAQ
jgi:hypothetical protein